MRCLSLAAAVAALTAAAPAEGQFADLKGTVIFLGPVPKRVPLNVNKDQAHCLSNGPILSEKLIVNAKNKGVKNCVIYLLPAADPNAPFPQNKIHPQMKSFKPTVEVDQPCCMYVPRIVIAREGQVFMGKNSSPIQHNIKYTSLANGSGNPLTPPGGKSPLGKVVGGKPQPLVKDSFPMALGCSIHPWMKGFMWCFDHPYAVLTDKDGKFVMKNVPVGKWRMVIWHESIGWNGGAKGRFGKVIEVKADGTDIGKAELKKPAPRRRR